MNRYPDPLTLQENARRLRREALSGMARGAAIRWKTLVALLRRRRPPLRSSHAPHPCQGPTPSHS
jgi:hypothetical protein